MGANSGRMTGGLGNRLRSFRALFCVSLAASLLFACAGTATRVEYGGVMNPQSVPADALSCAGVEWYEVEQVSPRYPMDLVRFRYLRQDASASDSFKFSFDVDETGSPANIRFVSPEAYMRHATMRQAILATAEALEKWRFHAEGEPKYFAGCTTRMRFDYQVLSTY